MREGHLLDYLDLVRASDGHRRRRPFAGAVDHQEDDDDGYEDVSEMQVVDDDDDYEDVSEMQVLDDDDEYEDVGDFEEYIDD